MPNFNIEETSQRINNIITVFTNNLLNEEGEIVFSSILPRKDNMDKVNIMNDFLVKIPRRNHVVRFMGNNNITERMLTDRKHLGFKGFRTLLANIRFSLFGKLPRSFAASRYNGDEETRYKRQSYDNYWNGRGYTKL